MGVKPQQLPKWIRSKIHHGGHDGFGLTELKMKMTLWEACMGERPFVCGLNGCPLGFVS